MRSSTTNSGFEKLMRPYMHQLYRSAFRFTGNAADAEDLLQDLLTKLIPRHKTLLKLEQPGPWLTKVMYRIYLDNSRRYRRSPIRLVDVSHNRIDNSEFFERVADPAPGPEECADNALLQKRLKQALGLLKSDHRALLALHDMEGYSLPELKLILGVPLGTLKSRLSRARARLRELLDEGTF